MMYKICGLQRLLADNPMPTTEDRVRKVDTANIRFTDVIYKGLLTHLKKKIRKFKITIHRRIQPVVRFFFRLVHRL